MILYDFLGGKSYRECFSSLTIRFGEKSPAKSTDTKMVQTISVRTKTLESDKRCALPVTVVTVKNVVKAKSLIKEDPRITHEQIQDALGISSGSVKQILHDHLGVSKRCAR